MYKNSNKGKYESPEGSRTWEYLSALFTAFGMTCIGNMLGWNSPSLAELSVENSRIHVTSEEASTLTASFAFGTMFALPLAIYIVDKIGRKNTVLVSTIPMILNWGMIVIAEDVVVLIVARIMAGFSLGLIVCTCPIHMVEILSAKTRGSLGAIGGVTCFGGILFMFAAAPHLGIRVTAGICFGLTMLFLICFSYVPESPYFLVMVGKMEEAEKALEKLRGKNDVADEMELIKATIREQENNSLIKRFAKESQNPLRLLFTVRGNLKAFLIGLTLTTMQHFCGFQIILYYCHIILKDMGSALDVYKATVVFSILQIFAIFLYALVVDKFGRRTLLITSGTSTVSLLAIIATYFYLKEHTGTDVNGYEIIPLGSVFILVVALNIGVMTLPTMIMAEMFATNVKVLGGCSVGVFGNLMGILSTKSYLPMATTWGLGHSVPFFIFAITTLVCLLILIRFLPETKGKTLLEIQRELNAGPV